MNKPLQYSDQEALQVLSTEAVGFAKVAFKQLYDQHFTVVYRVALRILGSSDLAQDMAQEIFTTVWIKRADLSRVNNFEAYIRTAVKNLAYDHFKKQLKSEAAGGEYVSQMQVNDDGGSGARYNKALRVLEELPPKAREVFELAKVEGLSYNDIAERLKISPITVNHHMSAALKLIRRKKYEVGAFVYWSTIFSIV